MPATEIVTVLVLYRRELEKSEAFVSLRQVAEELPVLAARVRLLLYDNSPEEHAVPQAGVATTYRHDASNGGLAPAYNAALALARDCGAAWLMLLDQDTAINAAYFAEVFAFLHKQGGDDVVMAAVPRLVENEIVHSPRSLPTWTHRTLPAAAFGRTQTNVMAYNSGALLRVEAMLARGGFPEEYTLDFLDHVIFHRLQAEGGQIWLLESAIKHQLSTHAPTGGMPPQRYRRMLRNERRFYKEIAGRKERFWYQVRLVRRVISHIFTVEGRSLAQLELRSLLGLSL